MVVKVHLLFAKFCSCFLPVVVISIQYDFPLWWVFSARYFCIGWLWVLQYCSIVKFFIVDSSSLCFAFISSRDLVSPWVLYRVFWDKEIAIFYFIGSARLLVLTRLGLYACGVPLIRFDLGVFNIDLQSFILISDVSKRFSNGHFNLGISGRVLVTAAAIKHAWWLVNTNSNYVYDLKTLHA